MQKRLGWTIIFSALAIGIIIPLNILITLNVNGPQEQARANFITIMIVESILIFGVVFAVVNEYFTVHTDYDTVAFRHKKENPNIPLEYYKKTNNDDNVTKQQQQQEEPEEEEEKQKEKKKDDLR